MSSANSTDSESSDSDDGRRPSPPSAPSLATCGEIVRREKIILHRKLSLSFQTTSAAPSSSSLSKRRREKRNEMEPEESVDERRGSGSHRRARVGDEHFSLRIIAGLREKLRIAREELRRQKEETKQILEEKMRLKTHLHMNQWNMGQLGPLMRRCSEASVSSAPGCLKGPTTPPGLFRARSTSAIRTRTLSTPPRSRHPSQKWGIEGRLRRRLWCCASKEVYARVSTFMRALCFYAEPSMNQMIQFVPIDSKGGIASGQRQISFDGQNLSFTVNCSGFKGTFVCEDVHDFQRWKTAIKELMHPG